MGHKCKDSKGPVSNDYVDVTDWRRGGAAVLAAKRALPSSSSARPRHALATAGGSTQQRTISQHN